MCGGKCKVKKIASNRGNFFALIYSLGDEMYMDDRSTNSGFSAAK